MVRPGRTPLPEKSNAPLRRLLFFSTSVVANENSVRRAQQPGCQLASRPGKAAYRAPYGAAQIRKSIVEILSYYRAFPYGNAGPEVLAGTRLAR